MLEVEVFGTVRAIGAPSLAEVRHLCAAAAASAGIHDGHVAIEFVDEERIAQLNAEHRRQAKPTDVLAFPIDGVEQPIAAALRREAACLPGEVGGFALRELGDVVICPAHTSDIREAVVHGMLHLLGMDHEADGGEMLALQARLLQRERR